MELQNYELVLILSPRLQDEEVGPALERLGQAITTRGGTVVSIEQGGRRKLAYPIKNFGDGNYVLARLRLASSSVPELDRTLRLSQEILRHLLVKVEGKMPPAPVAAAREGGKGVEEHGKSE